VVNISCHLYLPYGKYVGMKTLRTYLDSLPRGGISVLAKKLGVKHTYLCRLATGDRGITAEWALRIAKATSNELPAWVLRPDLFDQDQT
jgi:DNA-binding transcriptional regulator YdaS (Cro superfamily)